MGIRGILRDFRIFLEILRDFNFRDLKGFKEIFGNFRAFLGIFFK